MTVPKNPESKTTHVALNVNNMVCTSCEKIIEKSLHKVDGVKHITISYRTGKARVSYDSSKVTQEKILETIETAGYNATCEENASQKKFSWEYIALGFIAVIILIFAYIAVESTLGRMNISVPQLDAQTSVVLIFIVGLLTGFHCIAMCGGFVLGYTAQARKSNPSSLNLKLHAQYAFGKTLSYTLIGALFGLVGSVITFSPLLRALVAFLAGIFLILFGLKLLNIFPMLRKVSLPQGLFDKLKLGPLKNENSNPFFVGLANGLFIACGPLQAMYVLAATSGSPLIGGAMLFAFGIGTLIPMMGFAVFASFLGQGFHNKIIKVSALIVLIMGILMINNALALTGNGFSFAVNPLATGVSTTTTNSTLGIATPGTNPSYQIIRMEVTNAGYTPSTFVLKKGVLVKWIINGKELTGCNSGIIVPAYNLDFKIKPGEQTIEFTPTESGTIKWSCWMGMIQGSFIVKDDVTLDSSGKVVVDAATQTHVATTTVSAQGGGCGCMGGGASTCQMKRA